MDKFFGFAHVYRTPCCLHGGERRENRGGNGFISFFGFLGFRCILCDCAVVLYMLVSVGMRIFENLQSQ